MEPRVCQDPQGRQGEGVGLEEMRSLEAEMECHCLDLLDRLGQWVPWDLKVR